MFFGPHHFSCKRPSRQSGEILQKRQLFSETICHGWFTRRRLQKSSYSRTCIKRHRIKRSTSQLSGDLSKSRKLCPLIIAILTSIKRSPLLSGRGHPLLSNNELFLMSWPVLNGHFVTKPLKYGDK